MWELKQSDVMKMLELKMNKEKNHSYTVRNKKHLFK